MKLISIHIDNFGRLSNIDLNLTNGLNECFKENGWGKTSLSIFIKAMFYGMAASRDNVKMERKKYMPWQGGTYGGNIEFECNKGHFKIIRSFAKTPEGDETQLIDLDKNKELEFPKEGLGEWIFGVGKETFEMTAFFPQLNFLASTNEQISAGVLGLDKLKFDLASVGMAMSKIKKEISAVKKLSVKQSEIDRVKKLTSDLKLDLAEAEKNLSKIKQEISSQNKEISMQKEEVEREKKNLELQEKMFASKLKIDEEIKRKNEELATILTKLNEIKPAEENRSQTNPYPWTCGVCGGILVVSLIVLAVMNIISWLIAGIGAAFSFCLTCAAILFIKRRSREKEKNQNEQPDLRDELQQKIEVCKSQLESLKISAETFAEVSSPNKDIYEEKQSLLFNNRIALEKRVTEQQVLYNQIERLLQEIDEQNDQIVRLKERKEGVEEKLNLLERTYEFLSQAQENVSTRFVGPINREMEAMLSKFDMRGRKYVVDTNFDIKQDTSGGIKPFEQSSQGYQDILSFCMRLLLIKQVYKQEKPFVVLDDTFVNMDDKNFEKANEVLKDFAKDYQIIYICCREKSKIKD